MDRITHWLYLAFLASLSLRSVELGAGFGPLGSVSPTQLLGLATFGALLGKALLGRRRLDPAHLRQTALWVGLLTAYVLSDSLAAVINDSAGVMAHTLRARVATLITFMLGFSAIRSDADERRALLALLFSASVLAVTILTTAFGIYDFTEYGGRISRYESGNILGTALPRTSGVLQDFGDIALLFAAAGAILTAALMRDMRFKLLNPLFLATLALAALIAAAAMVPLSRNVWASCLTAIAVTALLYAMVFHKRQVVLTFFVIFGASIALSVLALWSNTLISMMLEMRQHSTNVRSFQYRMAFESISEHPLLGAGAAKCVFGGFAVHNMPLLAICRSGLGALPLLAFYLLLPLAFARDLLRRPPREARGAAASGAPGTSEARKFNTVIGSGSFAGFAAATMLFPSGASNSSEISWGLLGLFAAMAARRHGGAILRKRRAPPLPAGFAPPARRLPERGR